MIKVILLTKNEHDLIERFIQYYGAHVGLENIRIIDNGSTLESVLDVYKKYKVEVIFDDFSFDMATVCTKMTKYMEELDCDWILPVETDEFVIFDDLKKTLENVDEKCSTVLFKVFDSCVDVNDSSYKDGQYEDPVINITNFVPTQTDKFIVRKKHFRKMTFWLHQVETSGYKVNSFIPLIHFCNTGKKRAAEKAKSVISNKGVVGKNGIVTIDFSHNVKEQLLLYYKKPIVNGHKINILYDFLMDVPEKEMPNDVLKYTKIQGFFKTVLPNPQFLTGEDHLAIKELL